MFGNLLVEIWRGKALYILSATLCNFSTIIPLAVTKPE